MYQDLSLHSIIGVDEAGRGPLAGPVVAAAVIISAPIPGLTDSKKLSEKKRTDLAKIIKDSAVAYAIARVDAAEIDAINIHQATLLAMKLAIEDIRMPAKLALIDGQFAPSLNMAAQTLIQGDLLHQSISAASVLAKVERDKLMLEYDHMYPEFLFAKHKGYGTAQHLAALQTHGPCPIHRKSFAPIKNLDFQFKLG